MKLYFLRHALAGDREKWQGDDRLRPLTKKGKDTTRKSIEFLDYLIPDLDAIITSPLVRAKQTAEIVAEGFGMGEELIVDERLAPGFDEAKLAEIVKAYPEAEALMLVGHEPDFSQTVSAITGGSQILFRKGGLARVDLIDGEALQGELVWLLPPKVLAV
jgi:phosphohistidine phosphatase